MLTTIEGEYTEGKVELHEKPTGIKRARVIVTFLPDAAESEANGLGVDLFGIWKDRVPADADIESLLQDLRNESSLALNE